MTNTLRGMATVNFYADDMAAARQWYTELLGIPPYFEREFNGSPAYVEFRIGDYQDELGIIHSNFKPKGAATVPGGAIVHWHVDNIETTFARLIDMGAKEYDPITKRGDSGFVTASVIDPFGNVLGIMHNPHYLEMLDSLKK